MTIFGISVSMAVIWLALAVIFLIIEAITVGLTTIWFAAGAFAAFVLSLLNVPVLAQVVIFLAVSCCLLVFTRKIFVEKLRTGSESTNVDALIGETGIVTEEIRPLTVGQVKINGQVWSALGKDDETIEKDRLVKVIAIEGVKLIVIPK
ncbi:MAG: NfeD family protein [Candidatus Fimisoma sp.]|nr:NfeD family protein [Bacillota bacterium]MDY4748877.1 NfeD family protein [Candidatus Fimisoma sp.]